MIELKPCPFCGGEAILFADTFDDGKIFVVNAHCDSCGATGNDFHDEKQAIEAWNRRVENE